MSKKVAYTQENDGRTSLGQKQGKTLLYYMYSNICKSDHGVDDIGSFMYVGDDTK